MEETAVAVDVLPDKPESLALPQAGVDENADDCLHPERVARLDRRCAGDEGVDLVDGEDALLRLRGPRLRALLLRNTRPRVHSVYAPDDRFVEGHAQRLHDPADG